MENTVSNVGPKTINEAVCDRGYKGKKEVTINDHTISISIPGKQCKRDTQKQIQEKKEKFKRRAAIEPVIGHLKSDHRMESVTELCKELKIKRATLYKYISPTGELREYAKRVLEK